MLEQTTPGRGRTGRTIGDYCPSAWTFGTGQVDIIRNHWCGPPPSPAILTHHDDRPSSTVPGCSYPPWSSPIIPGHPFPLLWTNMPHPIRPAVLPKEGCPAIRRTRQTTASRPVPSQALGSPLKGGEHWWWMLWRTLQYSRGWLDFTDQTRRDESYKGHLRIVLT